MKNFHGATGSLPISLISCSSVELPKSVFQEHGDRVEPVAPADLLPARAVSRVEPDRALHDAATLAQQLRRNLRFDVETIRLEVEAASDRRGHDLVAGFHVREVSAEQHVRQPRKA